MRNAEQDERHTFRINICAENFCLNARLNYIARNFFQTLNLSVNLRKKLRRPVRPSLSKKSSRQKLLSLLKDFNPI